MTVDQMVASRADWKAAQMGKTSVDQMAASRDDQMAVQMEKTSAEKWEEKTVALMADSMAVLMATMLVVTKDYLMVEKLVRQ
eukprot:CAMPEP_0175013948 /NCGR_PEP_ID=MMETSP0005-20121125/10237_1 /TAXON_ID=420556 /ORGANISM="Ochromonas sp., Strain CCMP1393" /LENGTH=81 /DNA_ID=CAMNT_0016270531 /DNA_START=769 /DNA_END=1014 /DNA_ORIENTATION=-